MERKIPHADGKELLQTADRTSCATGSDRKEETRSNRKMKIHIKQKSKAT
jgi:hypothetical protein